MSGYIGNIPVPQVTQTRDTFTATSGQTSFATSGYTPGYLDVYLNGVHLVNGTDYTATNGSDVVLTVGAALNDIVQVVSFSTFTPANQTFTGDFSVDSPTFVVDSTNNRVGVNNASPAQALDVTGNIAVSGTVDGRDVAADGTKLDGIEAGADVTDTANVTAAGALMDSELTNITAVKALNQGVATTDSPNFAALNVNGTVTADGLTVDSATAEFGIGIYPIIRINTTGDNAIFGLSLDGNQSGTYNGRDWRVEQGRNGVGNFNITDITAGNRVRASINSVGNISFYEDTGTTAKFFWDAGAERLGINTTTPVSTLDLGSSTGVKLTLLPTNYSIGVESNELRIASNQTTTFYSGGHSGTERVRIDASGNVGIGTSSPAQKLDVVGNIAVSQGSNIYLTNNTGFSPRITNSSDANSMQFFQANTERMRIDSSGNLLVGMTTASTSNDGAGIRADGLIHGKRADVVATFNRKTTDGTIVELAKDNTVVGSIGVINANNLRVGGSVASHGGLQFGTQNVTPMIAGAESNGGVDLGAYNLRFKDLYLSGDISNGTTSVNVSYLISGPAKQWVNFNGSSFAINDSFNTTSMTDNGAGDYTVTIATDFANAFYQFAGQAEKGTDSGAYYRGITQRGSIAAGSYRLHCGDFQSDNSVDSVKIGVAAHGDLA